MSKLIALPMAAEEIRKRTGQAIGYRRIYEAILNGRVPSVRMNGRHHLELSILSKMPELLNVDALDSEPLKIEFARVEPEEKQETQTTAVCLPESDVALLRRVAGIRAAGSNSRASVSDVIRSLISKSRSSLENEIKRSRKPKGMP